MTRAQADREFKKSQLVRSMLRQPEGHNRLAFAMFPVMEKNLKSSLSFEERMRVGQLVRIAAKANLIINYETANRVMMEIQDRIMLARYK